MISALGRDGLVASVTMTRTRSTALRMPPARQLSCAAVLPHRALRRGPQYTLGFRYTHPDRFYSTIPPPTEKTSGTSGTEPPIAPRSKKPKVDLHPAPLRPSPTPAPGSSVPKASAKSAAAHDPTTTASANSHTNQPDEGIITTAKHDIEEAAQHGILKPPPENANRLMKLFHQAKELFKFYVRGIKLINTNRKRANLMRERVKNGGPPLTRWETRFIRTYQEDALKLIPFALIIIIAEEVIPLVVMYAPFILPSTCILPSQKERIENKKREKRAAYAAEMAPAFEEVRRRALADPAANARALLAGQGMDAIGGVLGHSAYVPGALRFRQIQRHLQRVAEDDTLLVNEEMGKGLTEAEVREALEERGILTNGLTPKQLQSRLRWWLTQVSQDGHGADPVARRVVLVASSGAGLRGL